MKKLGSELRLTGAARQKKYIQAMKSQGYKKTSIYMTDTTKEWLKDFCKSQGYTHHGALESLINSYNIALCTNKDIEQKQAVQEITVKSGCKNDELEFEPDTPPQPAPEPPQPAPEQPQEKPKQGTPEYHPWLYTEIARLKATGLSFGKIEKQFNKEGTLSVTGGKFTRNMANNFFTKEKKRRAVK